MIRFSQMSACGDLPVLSALVLLIYPVYAQSQSAENLPKISSAELQQSSAKSATQVERERLARAQEQLNRQERQRILGIIPNFGTSLIPDAETLSPYQKLHLALKSTLDPFKCWRRGSMRG